MPKALPLLRRRRPPMVRGKTGQQPAHRVGSACKTGKQPAHRSPTGRTGRQPGRRVVRRGGRPATLDSSFTALSPLADGADTPVPDGCSGPCRSGLASDCETYRETAEPKVTGFERHRGAYDGVLCTSLYKRIAACKLWKCSIEAWRIFWPSSFRRGESGGNWPSFAIAPARCWSSEAAQSRKSLS